jgi:hypothetical protein
VAPSSAPTPAFEFKKVVLVSHGIRFLAFLDSRRVQETAGSAAQSCNQVWQDYVAEQIKAEVIQVIPKFEILFVELSNATQSIDREQASLVFEFDVSISIRSPVQQHNVKRYIGGPFDSLTEQQEFVAFLRNTGCPGFASVRGIAIELPSELTVEESRSRNAMGAGLIAGLAVALLAAALLAATFMHMRLRNRRRLAAELVEEEEIEDPLANAHSERYGYASEIGVKTNMTMSSLGDPIPMGLHGLVEADISTQDPTSVDYDYQKAFANPPSASEFDSQSGASVNRMIQRDDLTLDEQYASDEQFEVLVGPGPLGLILATSEEGVPVVNNIKPSSVVIDSVGVGDRLISFDGVDVTDMLAGEVSKLIASKKNARARKLVFMRRVQP